MDRPGLTSSATRTPASLAPRASARRVLLALVAGGCLALAPRLAAQFTWNSGDLSTVGIPGNTLTAAQTLAIATGADHDLPNQTLTNNGGTITWNAGNIRGGSSPGSSIINLAGGTFADANASGYVMTNPFGGTFSFDNQGSYVRNVAGSSSLFDIPFLNSGSVNVLQGSIQFRAGGTMTGAGTMTAALGTSVTFTNGYSIQSGASLGGAGTFLHSGGTMTLAGTVNLSNYQQNGGTLAGDQTFGSGTYTWNAGTWSGSGNTTTISAGATLNIATGADHDLASRSIVNQGTVNWTAGYIRGGSAPGSSFLNAAGATFNDLNGSGYAMNNPFGGTFTFTNAGTYVRNAGGTTFFDVPFDNSGTVDLQAGSIQIRAGGTLAGTGTITAATGTSLIITNGYTLDSGSTLTGAGTFQLNGGTLTLNGTVSVSTFTQVGGALAGTNTINGTFNWNAGNWNGATTTIGAGGILNINTGSDHDFAGRTITNQGTVNWNTGYIRSGSGGAFVNAAGATFNDLNGSSYTVNNPFGGTFTFTNNGTYVRNAPGITYFDVPFDNNATVNLQQGEIQYRAGGTLATTGSITAAAGTTVTFTNGYNILNGASLAGAGGYRLAGGTLTLNGGVAVGSFLQTGGTLAGDQTLTSGTFTWNAGTWSGSGNTTTIGPAATLIITTGADHDLASRTITNQGTVNWNTGYIRGGSAPGSAFINAAGATFNDFNASGYTVYNPFGGTFTFTNNGSYVRNAAGTTYFDVPFVNNSTVNLQQGALQFRAGGTLATTGSITAAAGTTVTFTNGFSIQSGSSLGGAGTFALNGGVLTLDGSVAVGTFTQSGGTLAGTQTLASGIFNWNAGDWNTGAAATTTIGPGATLNINTGSDHDFANRTVVNQGVVVWNTGYIRGGSAPGSTFLNAAGGTFVDNNASGYTINNPFGGTFGFTNDGTYLSTGGVTSFVDVPFTNNGTLILEEGDLQLRGGTTFNPAGTLRWVLGGPTQIADFGLLSLTGAFTLAGNLDFVFAGGFETAATSGQTFTLLNSGGLAGSFTNVANGARLTSSDGLGSFLVHYGPSSSFAPTSVVLSSFIAVPEPSTWALLLLGGSVVALRLRPRRP